MHKSLSYHVQDIKVASYGETRNVDDINKDCKVLWRHAKSAKGFRIFIGSDRTITNLSDRDRIHCFIVVIAIKKRHSGIRDSPLSAKSLTSRYRSVLNMIVLGAHWTGTRLRFLLLVPYLIPHTSNGHDRVVSPMGIPILIKLPLFAHNMSVLSITSV